MLTAVTVSVVSLKRDAEYLLLNEANACGSAVA